MKNSATVSASLGRRRFMSRPFPRTTLARGQECSAPRHNRSASAWRTSVADVSFLGAGPPAVGAREPESRAGTRSADAVSGIGELALLQGETAAADALRESLPQPFELGDAIVNPSGPPGRQLRPVGALRHAIVRALRQLHADLIEREADLLGEDDEGNPGAARPLIAAMARPCPLRCDQPAVLIEPQRGRGDAAAPRDLGDSEQIAHDCPSARAAGFPIRGVASRRNRRAGTEEAG